MYAEGAQAIFPRLVREKSMTSRDDILARVRRNQPAAVALPEVPLFGDMVHDFKSNLENRGRLLTQIKSGSA
jgi:hypothetical protein